MDTTKTCPKCGKPLAAIAPAGLCPECLMQAGFPTGTETDIAGKKFSFRPPSVEELKPQFPQLEILSYIGQGGMGAVYKARQPLLDRYVALKILPPEAATGVGFTERFTREARALARLNHPNIVAVHEFGQSGGYHYLLMEFVDGANLREMERAQRLSPAQALSIVPKICDALQYAHDEGVVHRDIKPENILVDKKGRVKIADFGIAKILGAEQPHAPLTGVVGTPHYMAPEQVEKPKTVDHRADIYSVGVVFYEMLTGELPLGRFAAPSKKVQIDVRLDEVVLRALEKEPEQRYQQVTQLKTQVETIASSPTIGAPAPNLTPRETRRQVVVPLSFLAVGVLIFVIGAAIHGPNKLPMIGFGAISIVVALFLALKHWPALLHSEQGPNTSKGWLQRRNKFVYGAVAALLLLDFILPHSWSFSAGIRFGVTQPWLFLPHNGYGVIFNPLALSFFSGVVAAVTALILIATERGKLNFRYVRWAGSVAIAILAVAVIRVAIEPYVAVNDAVAPEINPGSRVFVYKLAHRFQPGDIVVYRWFATGYPTKFLIGRVVELLNDNAISIERRNQAPQKILLSDIVGKVIFNTRSGATYTRPRLKFGPVVERTINDIASKTNCVLNLMTGELLSPPPDVLKWFDPLSLYKPALKPPEYQRVLTTVQNWCLENDAHLVGPVTRTPHLNAVGGLSAVSPAKWNMSVEDLTNCFFNMDYLPVGSIQDFGLPMAVDTQRNDSGVYAYKSRYGAMGLFKILSTNKWPNPSITIQYKVLRDSDADETGDSQQRDLTNVVQRASAELWAPSPLPTDFTGMHKILDQARKLTGGGEYEKALQHFIWYYNHSLEIDAGQSGVRGSFALSYWMELGEKYPKALQALAEIRDDTAERLRVGHGDFKTFMDLHNLNRELKDDEGTYSVFKIIEQHDSALAKQCYLFIEDMLVGKGEYQTCKKYIGDPQTKYDRIRQGYEMEMGSAKHFADLHAKVQRDIAAVQARVASNSPARRADEASILKSIPSRDLRPPDAAASMPRFAEDRFVTQVCRLIEILIATGSPDKANEILSEAKEVLKSSRFDSAIADAQQRIAAHQKPNK